MLLSSRKFQIQKLCVRTWGQSPNISRNLGQKPVQIYFLFTPNPVRFLTLKANGIRPILTSALNLCAWRNRHIRARLILLSASLSLGEARWPSGCPIENFPESKGALRPTNTQNQLPDCAWFSRPPWASPLPPGAWFPVVLIGPWFSASALIPSPQPCASFAFPKVPWLDEVNPIVCFCVSATYFALPQFCTLKTFNSALWKQSVF